MTLSISTFGLFNTMLGSAKSMQQAVAEASMQQSTGLVGTDFASLGSKSQQLLNMQTEINQTQTYSDLTGIASDRSQASFTAIGNMIDRITDLRSAIGAALNGDDDTTLAGAAQSILSDLGDQMNSQLNGRYLFAGSQTDSPPVDLSNYPATLPPSTTTPDFSYYQGDDQIASVRITSTESVSYGVTGDNSAFELALRSAAVAANVTTSPLDTATLQTALDMANQALNSLSNLQATVSVGSNSLKAAQQSQTTYISLLTDATSNIKSVDAAEALSKVTQLTTQLQASYSALSVVMKIKLTDFL